MLEPFLSAEEIAGRVRALGAEVRGSGGEGPLLLVGILKGAAVFVADLLRAVPPPVDVAFLRARSYGDRTESSGRVEIDWPGPAEVQGRDVVLVDTVLDTGHTLAAACADLRKRGVQSILTCVLLDKAARRVVPVHADLVGFAIPDVFVVGYGLDHAGRYRGLPYLATVRDDAPIMQSNDG